MRNGWPGAVPAPGGTVRKRLAIAVKLLAVVYLAGLGGLLFWANVPMLAQWQPRVVLSGSMTPALHPGDVVLVGPVESDTVPLQRIVLVTDPGRATGTYLHRVVRYDDGRLVTKGDANRSEDLPAVEPSRVAGQARLVVPLVGMPVVWAHDSRFGPVVAVTAGTWLALIAVLRRRRRAGGRRRRRPAVRSQALLTLAVVPVLVAGITAASGVLAAWTGSTGNGPNTWGLGGWASTTTGELTWWGSGGNGQGGAGDVVPRWTMAAESTGATTWSAVSVGTDHTCATRADGTLWCWGGNAYGQLGLGVGDTTDRGDPTQVGGATWSAVAAGGGHTCATRTDGTLWCWGLNDNGQLGINSTTNQSAPTQVTSPATTGWVSVVAGHAHSCALRTGGTLYCWGDDDWGALGNGSPYTDRLVANQVSGTTWSAVAAARDNTCATTTGNTLWCWGRNGSGQFVNGNSSRQHSPLQIAGTTWVQAAVGAGHVCARKQDGTIWCAGLNASGQLGQGDTTTRTSAMTQVGAGTWTDLAARGNTTCALASGTAWCWGSGLFGALGLGDSTDRLSPTQGPAGAWSKLGLGSTRLCLVASAGALACAGSDTYGGLGRGGAAVDQAASATLVTSSVADWVALDGGAVSTCGVAAAGTLWCWGANDYGQLGTGDTTARSFPTQIGSATLWASVTVGDAHACATRTDGTLWCWGRNADGQLGLGVGDTTDRDTPVRVGALTTWQTVVAGGRHTCGLRTGDTMWCWGDNASGQLGLSHYVDQTTPAQVDVTGVSPTTWTSIGPGNLFTCAVRMTGALYCWGDDSRYQLGAGTASPEPTPTPRQTGFDSDWTSVSAGDYFVCGLRTTNMYCWGANDRGQTGTANVGTDRSKPDYQAGNGTAWQSARLGAKHACALSTSGTVWCWGANDYGQLGLGWTVSGSPCSTTLNHCNVPMQLSWPPKAVGLTVGGDASYALIGAYPGAVLADGPAGYWRLGEPSGTTAAAFSGSPNGTYAGTPGYGAPGALSGDPDTAVTFSGDDRVGFGDVHDFAGTAAFTVELWLKRSGGTPASRQFAVAKERYVSAGDRGGWAIMIASSADGSPNSIVAGRYAGAAATEVVSTTQTVAGTWYHVALTYDGTTMTLYVDGVPESSAASAVSVEDHASAMTVGALQTSNYFTGTLDDVAVYGSALPAGRISAHHAARIA